MTPKEPDAPEAPRVIAKTDTTALIVWTNPPCFNLEPTAFHLQYRIGAGGKWVPEKGLSIEPTKRSRKVSELIAGTPYQFRIRAENKMGKSKWSEPSKLVRNFSVVD